MIKVHITDDHKMLVEGLKAAIDDSGVAQTTGVSYSLNECRKAIMQNIPDVLLLDISMPDGSGIDFCSEMHERYQGMKILILTSHDEYTMVRRALSAGASGYILKNALSEEVVKGIETACSGELFLSHQIDLLMKKKTNDPVLLTAREQELLHYIVNGSNNQEIAEQMCLSIETIKTYRKNLIQKFGARNSMDLVRMAIQDKWV
ncbi:MAG: response regulator transcription factor [Porphyromonas sp.]|nr:response regulator transcription factor [Porphyromonas sp.]